VTTNAMCSFGAAILAAAFAAPATAQIAGYYDGTSADGLGVSFQVGTDPSNGNPAIVSAGFNFAAPCKNSSLVLDESQGYFITADISNRNVTDTTSTPFYWIKFSLKFSSDGLSATGTVTSVGPYLNPANSPPIKSLTCKSPTQSLSVTYSHG